MDGRVYEIYALFERQGRQSYGEAVSQFDHAIQAATLARDWGHDDTLIAAAFLHDVGHLLEQEGMEAMGAYGAMAHDKLGEDYLLSLGFNPAVAMLVGAHVAAKRYLCAVDPGYRARLSPASEATLGYQGGPMSPEEADAFACHPDREAMLTLRRLDEAAKDGGWSLDQAEWVWPLLARQLD
ncbi:phosphonate degradation HD-domain oxygenase [Chromobacterium sp. IIBBL 290-4]|uniref:phosphonate degradation HD-domain oxygenase n=1 Tax=Chromobacterium sp. IIBBL 290-4 TaxID=2953890 RepID=UPI0020B6C637|nr:phosphonate degradation HD-domain oxygenase [Chromobacterium sp. IIBBL 290-4]UTH74843.1 HD domain-containing protein [Chromobacterium sp. IIBBL 290-4]